MRDRRWRQIGLSLFVAITWGCGDSSPPPPVVATGENPDAAQAAPVKKLRMRIHTSSAGVADSVDLVGLEDEDLAAFEKLSERRRGAALAVYVVNKDQPDPPAVLGEATRDGDALRFTPRYPLGPDLSYRMVLQGSARAKAGESPPDDISLEFKTAALRGLPKAVVSRIFPSSDQLPENQLKFYIHFSAPMSRGEAYRHIHLLDADNQEIEGAFLELGEELWDPEMRRFTLLCDPGRVKRELKPREDLGPVLEEGKSYTLVVDRNWADANGSKLAEGGRKTFQVMPPDEAPIDITAWEIEPPAAGTTAAVVVRFPEPYDHSLLERILSIVNPEGEKLAGTIEVSDKETSWQFKPSQRWEAGTYQLVAQAMLEDLAGNSIGRAFDVDVFAPVQDKIATETVSIPFTIEKADAKR